MTGKSMKLHEGKPGTGSGLLHLPERKGRITGRIAAAVIVLLLAAAFCFSGAAAEAASDEVYVTISDDKGELVLTQQAVNAEDSDGDGALTVNDVLYCAHEQFFEGGAAEGYETETSEYGLSLSKLWGIVNGGGYGYYVNNAAAMSLTDPVKAGDYVNAFVYQDIKGWSDVYCYFAEPIVETTAGEPVQVTLNTVSYDAASGSMADNPLKGAKLVVDGAASEAVTTEFGTAELTLDKEGSYVISAQADGMVLVPPVCTVNVAPADPAAAADSSGSSSSIWLWVAVAALILLIAVYAYTRVQRKK